MKWPISLILDDILTTIIYYDDALEILQVKIQSCEEKKKELKKEKKRQDDAPN